MKAGAGGARAGPGETGTGAAKAPKELLSTIIDALNQRFELNLPGHINAFLSGVSDALADTDEVRLGAEANDKANFAHIFNPALDGTMAEHHEDNRDFVTLFFQDTELRNFLTKRMLHDVYDRIRAKDAAGEAGAGSTSSTGKLLALKRVPADQVRPFVNAVPVYDLQVAAGRFSAPQAVEEVPQHAEVTNPSAFEWVALDGAGGAVKPAPGLFVARVVGESMNRKIPNGAWCVWRLNPSEPLEGKVVLAQHSDFEDTDLGAYTVKVYASEEVAAGGGGKHDRTTDSARLDMASPARRAADSARIDMASPARRAAGSSRLATASSARRIVLKPSSTDASFLPPVFDDATGGDLRIVAELVTVLG